MPRNRFLFQETFTTAISNEHWWVKIKLDCFDTEILELKTPKNGFEKHKLKFLKNLFDT